MENKTPEPGGLRFNAGKTRFDLLEPYALEQLAKVFTKGAEKYADNNWLKGMPWSKMVASLKRHLSAFEQGVDFDEETKLHHMAHVAWNAMGIVSFYKYHPQLDDRRHAFRRMPKIGLDIDEVICDWVGAYNKLHKQPLPHAWNFDRKMPERLKALAKDKKFWMGLKTKIDPADLPFEPAIYVTSRVIPSSWTEEWLDANGFPAAKVITVGPGESKVDAVLNSGVKYFVDDSFSNFAQLQASGVCCFLMDAKHNQRYDVGHFRIKTLHELSNRF